MCVGVYVYMCACATCMSACGGYKSGLDFLELELYTVTVSHLLCMPENKALRHLSRPTLPSQFLFIFWDMCRGVLLECMSVCVSCPQYPEEGFESSRAGVTVVTYHVGAIFLCWFFCLYFWLQIVLKSPAMMETYLSFYLTAFLIECFRLVYTSLYFLGELFPFSFFFSYFLLLLCFLKFCFSCFSCFSVYPVWLFPIPLLFSEESLWIWFSPFWGVERGLR